MMSPRYKKIFSVLETLFFVGIVAYLVISKGPQLIRAFEWEGKSVATSTPVFSLNKESINLVSSKKRVLIFWATWCGPCTIELDRINSFIKKNPQWKNDVLAVSIAEAPEIVKKVAQERGYEFNVAVDENGTVSNQFEIESTPTILFVESSDKIAWRSSGLSPSLGFRLQRFFESADTN